MAFGNDRSRFVDNDFSGKRYKVVSHTVAKICCILHTCFESLR